MLSAVQCTVNSVLLRQSFRLLSASPSLIGSTRAVYAKHTRLLLPNDSRYFHHIVAQPTRSRRFSAGSKDCNTLARFQLLTHVNIPKFHILPNSNLVLDQKSSFATLTEAGGQKTDVGFLKRMKAKVVAELKHYWLGSKLLAKNISITFGLVNKLISGDTLSRREHALLVQTVADIFMLIPFAIIVIVPFMEFALPLILKFFPNMLPSTFQHKSAKEEQLQRKLKVKLEVAKFLQDTMQNMALELKFGDLDTLGQLSKKEFQSIMTKISSGNSGITKEELLKVAGVFKEDLSLERLSRQQLIALCKYLSVPVIGSNYMIIFNLNKKLEKLRNDDDMILEEGIEQLTLEELVEACVSRGMKVFGKSREELEIELEEWLELSRKDIPPYLLIISRGISHKPDEPAEDVQPILTSDQILSHIPKSTVEKVAEQLPEEVNEVEIDLKKLDRLEQEVKEIAEEEEKEELEKRGTTTMKLSSPSVTTTPPSSPTDEIEEELTEDVKELRRKHEELEDDIEEANEDEEKKTGEKLSKKLDQLIERLEKDISKAKTGPGANSSTNKKDESNKSVVEEEDDKRRQQPID